MRVDPDIVIKSGGEVYEPSDDTYLLLELIEIDEGEDVLEVGSGSGIISIHCAYAGGKVTAVDISEAAVSTTEENASRNDIELDVFQSDLFSDVEGTYDVIIFNPPYLPEHLELELDRRWDAGERGDEVLMEFLQDVPEHLCDGGRGYIVYSDMSPTGRIEEAIQSNFSEIDRKDKEFQFETIWAVELRK